MVPFLHNFIYDGTLYEQLYTHDFKSKDHQSTRAFSWLLHSDWSNDRLASSNNSNCQNDACKVAYNSLKRKKLSCSYKKWHRLKGPLLLVRVCKFCCFISFFFNFVWSRIFLWEMCGHSNKECFCIEMYVI